MAYKTFDAASYAEIDSALIQFQEPALPLSGADKLYSKKTWLHLLLYLPQTLTCELQEISFWQELVRLRVTAGHSIAGSHPRPGLGGDTGSCAHPSRHTQRQR